MRNTFDYFDGDAYLAHHGIKGMKWGVRRSPEQLGHKVPRSTIRNAHKDAKEFARAKMYYGEGAGNRRKLIKATVDERSKDPDYKREFEKALAEQDMAKHASKAKTERKVRTAASKTAKTTRGIINITLGNVGAASATAATLYSLARVTGADKVIASYGKTAMTSVRNWFNDQTRLHNTFR